MTGIMTGFCVAILVVVLIGFLAVHLIMTWDTRGPRTFEEDEEKKNEWDDLVKKHDVKKGYEDQITDLDTHRYIQNLKKEIASRVPSSLSTRVKLRDEDAVDRFDPAAWVQKHADRDELREMCGASAARIKLWHEYRYSIDKACLMSAESDDPMARRLCTQDIRQIYAMLLPDMTFSCSCTPSDGHTYKKKKTLPRAEMLRLAGLPAEPEPALDDRMGKRYTELSRAGFRCSRCGRSPLSGGVLKLVESPGTERGCEVLCEQCAGRRR